MTNIDGSSSVTDHSGSNPVGNDGQTDPNDASPQAGAGNSGADAIDSWGMFNDKPGQATSNLLSKVSSSLNDADLKALEFLMFNAMIEIMKSKLDEFLTNMKDNIETIRQAKDKSFEQAASMRMQGLASMFSSIAGGVISIGAGAVSMVGAGMSFKSASSTGRFQLGKFQSEQMKWQGASQAVNSMGTMVEGGVRYSAVIMDAQGTEQHAESSKLSSMSQNMRDSGKADEEFFRSALATLKDMIDSSHQARSKIVG